MERFLFALTHGADLQALADLAAEYLEYPLVVRNYARDTLCCSQNYPMDDLEDRKNRHISLIRQTGTDDSESLEEFMGQMGTGKPYIRMYPYLRRARMFCGCVYNGVPVGYIMLPGTDKDYNAVALDRVERVAGIFAAALVLNGHPCRPAQDENTSLLWDLLRGGKEPPVPRLSIMHRPFGGLESFRLLWFPNWENQKCRELLSELGLCWHVELAEGCAVLADGKLDLKPVAQAARKLGISLGASGAFERPTEAYSACQQAKIACDYGKAVKPQESLYQYEKYEMLHWAAQALRHKKVHCFALHQMMDYDRKNNTEYFATLRKFFECGMDVRKTAERARVHRNTIAYRLEKIKELFDMDLKEPLDLSCAFWQLIYLEGIL